jgi:hypothetical protein
LKDSNQGLISFLGLLVRIHTSVNFHYELLEGVILVDILLIKDLIYVHLKCLLLSGYQILNQSEGLLGVSLDLLITLDYLNAKLYTQFNKVNASMILRSSSKDHHYIKNILHQIDLILNSNLSEGFEYDF